MAEIYNRQNELNERIVEILGNEENVYGLIDEQSFILEDTESLKEKLFRYESMENFLEVDARLDSAITDMDVLINSFSELQNQDLIPASVENIEDSTIIIMD